MYFCKEECERDILVGTTYKDLKKGRYSIRYLEGSLKEGFVFVSIKKLTQSDSGWYRCGLDRPNSNDPYQRFKVIVTDALTSSTPSSSDSSASTETSNQSESSTSLPTSPKTTEQPETSTSEAVVLYVFLTLVVLVIVSSLSVLVFCRKRTCKDKGEEPES
ncbi:CMRF35-like molecule 8 [Trematomus bernacchii]|uniref:CMRF35-like molecule 8 n=1 Tax=Trematomus bernacchii TaxID=40690 RepID=UPI00146A1556|nr:CMRF35-like molecule 8 [Trematomus bernacchii]